jgi:copper resistance protein D
VTDGLGASANDWLILVRTVHFAATATIAGVLIFRVAVAEPALRLAPQAAKIFDAQSMRVAWLSLGVTGVSGVAWLLLQAPAMSGLSFGEAMSVDILGTVVTETQFGLVSEIRLALVLILAACLASVRLAAARWLALASALGLVAAIAWTGHAASTAGELGILHLTADTLHLVAAAAWIGGLLSLALLLAAVRRNQALRLAPVARAAVQRFSTLGSLSVAALLASGIVNAWILVGSLQALLITEYGRLLVLKIALDVLMLAFAAINRVWLTPRLALPSESGAQRRAHGQLTRNCMIELALGFAIFAIVGVLGTLHPAIHLL